MFQSFAVGSGQTRVRRRQFSSPLGASIGLRLGDGATQSASLRLRLRLIPAQLTAAASPGTFVLVLGHLVLQYHYANDSPLSLLHISPNEQILVLDYNSPNPAFTHPKTRCMRKVSVVLTVHSTSLHILLGYGCGRSPACCCTGAFCTLE